MKLSIKDIEQVLKKEVEWCERNSDKGFSKEYNKGFINGIIHAFQLIVALNKKLKC